MTWIAAEDTRSSRPLLQSLGIGPQRCLSLHSHNEEARTDSLLARILAGDSVALISDAGTPAISDPGALLVAAAHAAGIRVVPVPGASATTALVSAAGLARGRFLFEGFLPTRNKQRRERLTSLAQLAHPFLIFEAPHRIEALAEDLLAVLDPARPVVIGRELTKRFEQIVRMPLAELPDWLAADDNHRRGEFALLILEAAQPETGTESESGAPSAIGVQAMRVLAAEMPPRQAAKLAARISGDASDLLYRTHLSQNKK